MAKKSKPTETVKPRNPVSQNPLLKKSHVHTKTKKAARAQAKQDLKKEIDEV